MNSNFLEKLIRYNISIRIDNCGDDSILVTFEKYNYQYQVTIKNVNIKKTTMPVEFVIDTFLDDFIYMCKHEGLITEGLG